jgi:hypothetical protein
MWAAKLWKRRLITPILVLDSLYVCLSIVISSDEVLIFTCGKECGMVSGMLNCHRGKKTYKLDNSLRICQWQLCRSGNSSFVVHMLCTLLILLQNLVHIISKSIALLGFNASNLGPKWRNDHQDFVIPRLAKGELKHGEEVHRGLDKVPDAFLALQKGQNKAKVVIVVADE